MPHLPQWLPASLTLSLLITACRAAPVDINDSWGYVSVGRGSAIQIGVVVGPNEAAYAEINEAILRGAEIAATDFGTVQGYPIQLIAATESCSGDGEAAEALSSRAGTLAVIGHICEPSCGIGASVYEDSRLTFVSPLCDNDDLTDRVLHTPSFLRTIPPTSRSMRVLADFAYSELGARRAAVISLEGHSESGSSAFATAFQALGGDISTHEYSSANPESLLAALQTVNASGADILLVDGNPSDVRAIAALRPSTGNAALPILTHAPITTDWYVSEAGASVVNVFAVAPRLSGANWDRFSQQYQSAFGAAPHAYAALSYDAAILVLNAIDAVVQDYRGDALYIGRGLLRTSVYETVAQDGVSGVLTCTTWGDCAGSALAVYSAQPTEWELVYAP